MGKISVGFVFLFTVFFTKAQDITKEVIANAGAPSTTANMELNFTLGEAIIGLVGNKNSVLDQGFWASFNINDLLQPNSDNETGIVVYPIPVEEVLNIATGQRQLFGLQLFAIDRRIVLSETTDVDQVEHQIEMGTIAPGVYVLQLFLRDENEPVLFKIIKE